LHELKEQRLVRFVLPAHGRSVVRYRHVLDETLGLDPRSCAVLAVLLLRGPQTAGELRIRTERMARFDGLDAVQHELDLLAAREEPLAVDVGRRPGQKEERWATPLLAAVDRTGHDDGGGRRGDDPASGGSGTAQATAPAAADGDRVDELAAELGALRAEVAGLRRELQDLRTGLGG